jgi:two-component system NtrC family response regulator
MVKGTVLVVEDKESMRRMLYETLRHEGYEVEACSKGEEGLKLLKARAFDLLLTDLRLPGMDGVAVVREAKKANPMLAAIVMTAYGSVESAVAAMKEGAYDYIQKPFDTDHLILLVERALGLKRLEKENLLLKGEREEKEGTLEIIGKSAKIEEVKKLALKVARSEATVLVSGESGTGKELFARFIHGMSPRRDQAFVAINCAAIPKELLENELFGSEKGAYTGSTGRKIGKFELADKGTVFLDEIGDMDLSPQSKILRVLQERTIERLGGTQTIPVNVRVVAATNQDLARRVKEKLFREDLFYRLSVFPITIPPLRERREDIGPLAEYFLKKASPGEPKSLARGVLKIITGYPWPGNVRELENTLERAAILCEGNEIKKEHLWLPEAEIPATDDGKTLRQVREKAMEEAEKRVILKAVTDTKGNKSEAAKKLGVSYRILLKKIKEYELD